MDSNNKLVKYEEETIFTKIRRNFFNLFNKNSRKIPVNQDFSDIYEKVKRREIDLNSLDKKTLYKIIKKLDEEIALNSKLLQNNINIISTDMKVQKYN